MIPNKEYLPNSEGEEAIALRPHPYYSDIVEARFECPGCDEKHVFRLREEGEESAYAGPIWTLEGVAPPTFSPSLFLKRESYKCHLYLREGKIEFLGDCTHSLAGWTGKVPPLPPYLR